MEQGEIMLSLEAQPRMYLFPYMLGSNRYYITLHDITLHYIWLTSWGPSEGQRTDFCKER